MAVPASAPGALLVTGASGFVGGAFAAAMRRAGRTVLALDRQADAAAGVLACDLGDAGRLRTLADGVAIAAIVHCGGISGPMLARDRPALVAQTNIGGTLDLLELARERSIPRFVFCSSGSVYGRTQPETALDEERPLHPTSVYAATKVAGEALVEAYARSFGFTGVSLRIAAVYGPGRRTACLVRDMVASALAGRLLVVPHGRDERYHHIHVDDVVTALAAAVSAAMPRRPAYAIAGDDGRTLGAIADLVRSIVPGAAIAVEPGEDPLGDPQGPWRIAAAAADLGWRPAVSLREGIARYAAWLAAQDQKS